MRTQFYYHITYTYINIALTTICVGNTERKYTVIYSYVILLISIVIISRKLV